MVAQCGSSAGASPNGSPRQHKFITSIRPQSGTNKKITQNCQLCPAIIWTPPEADTIGEGMVVGGGRVDNKACRRRRDGFAGGLG